MKKVIIILSVLLLISGCKQKEEQAPYTDAQAQVFEKKLEKANITIKERKIGDLGAVRIELGIQQDNEKGFTVSYSSPFVNVSWLESDPFYFGLNIFSYKDERTKNNSPIRIGLSSTYLNYGEGELEKDGIIGYVEYSEKTKDTGEYETCFYGLGRNKNPQYFEDLTVCDDEEVSLIRELEESKENAYKKANITDDDVVRYFTWYAINEKSIESSEE